MKKLLFFFTMTTISMTDASAQKDTGRVYLIYNNTYDTVATCHFRGDTNRFITAFIGKFVYPLKVTWQRVNSKNKPSPIPNSLPPNPDEDGTVDKNSQYILYKLPHNPAVYKVGVVEADGTRRWSNEVTVCGCGVRPPTQLPPEGQRHSKYISAAKVSSLLPSKQLVDERKVNISIGPNPVHEIINIYTNTLFRDRDATVKIFNLAGKRMYQKNLGTHSINIRSFNPGIYILQMIDKKGNTLSSQKFIKQ